MQRGRRAKRPRGMKGVGIAWLVKKKKGKRARKEKKVGRPRNGKTPCKERRMRTACEK